MRRKHSHGDDHPQGEKPQFPFLRPRRLVSRCLVLFVVCSASLAQAAMNRSFELSPEVLDGFGPVTTTHREAKETSRLKKRKVSASQRMARARVRHRRPSRMGAGGNALPAGTAMAFRLEAPRSTPGDRKTIRGIEALWKNLTPGGVEEPAPLTLRNDLFSLTLDPSRYPILRAMDGARILVDQDSSLPPLVRALLTAQEPSLRYVSGSPGDGKRFLSSLLAAGGFYSVMENAVLDFGDDPNIRVRFDHKVEQTADSLLRQEVALINDGLHPLPSQLTDHLRKAGFIVHEPFAVPGYSPAVRKQGSLFQISATNRTEMLDSLLDALGVVYRKDQRIDLFTGNDGGVSLSVTVQRSYEHRGGRYLVVAFDGNPVTYTLLRLLETRGYRVITLETGDDFRAVSEKILASLRIPAEYGKHDMWPAGGVSYSLRMSGFRLRGDGVPGGSMFLTNLRMEPFARELLKAEGYEVKIK